jgi:mannose-6-phosphate isomerase-like protein (cupin superfamily)
LRHRFEYQQWYAADEWQSWRLANAVATAGSFERLMMPTRSISPCRCRSRQRGCERVATRNHKFRWCYAGNDYGLHSTLARTSRYSLPQPRPRNREATILSTKATEETMTDKQWKFIHNLASEAKWTPGLRDIFEYRDLGIKDGTNGDYVAHLIRHNGKRTKDEVQQWHVHDCTFQLVYVLNGWATFEYEGQGQRTIRAGDCILQTPGIRHREIACSGDFEVLEIVSPANFATRVVEVP